MAASMEPKLTPEEDFKARRLEAIKAKALEITKVVRFAPRNNPTSVNLSQMSLLDLSLPPLVTLSLQYTAN